ncbi:fumigaclavine A dimethylallyltransferase [Penicillium hordei]|uniref:Fumigaclavine A dimethylallyltransferase n=1 Tax=Penicillium hordei TaxID=40994 RepID=A0AAD6DUP8_9EURO|nr:fumigaclavine A dimethylallyltransferase [Penicillium hordei]KAJ5592737.1 fumigaclavine A dimethylallyltransferase [Penicillium hordei]
MTETDSLALVSKGETTHNQGDSPYDVLSRSLLFHDEAHRTWWEQGGSKLAVYLRLGKHSIGSQYRHLLMFYSVFACNLGPWPNKTRDNITWFSAISPRGENLELSMNYQRNSKCTVRIAAETTGPLAGTEKDPFNVIAEKRMVNDLRAFQPNLNLAWFNDFEREVVVPDEVARKNRTASDNFNAKSQRLHGLDLAEGSFMLKSYFIPVIRSAITGVETAKIEFDCIRKLGITNTNFNTALNILQDWMLPTGGRFMQDWDGVSYDAIDADKARIKVYTGIRVKSLEHVREIWTLNGRLQGDFIDKGFKLVTKLWKSLMDEDFSNSEVKNCMQWVWELRSDVDVPVPKLYFTVAETEDHHVSKAVVEILEYLDWHEHVQTHLTLMDDAW